MGEAILRQPLRLSGRTSRTVEERLVLRFPRLAARLARAVWRLPLRSRVRRAIVGRAVAVGWDAMNRGDLVAGLALYHPDVVSIFDPGMVSIGFGNTRGREDRLRMLNEAYGETWDGMRFEPDELIYLDEQRLLVIGRMRGAGAASRAPFETFWANLWMIADGLVIRDQVIADRDEALRVATRAGAGG